MKLTRRSLLSGAIVTGAAIGLNQNLLSAATSLAITQPDLAADPRRPQFHLVPPSHWMNDPNGPIYWNGVYHMFYQCNPTKNFVKNMVWGHAVSPDMLHWRHMPIALKPTPGGPDADGCWTGTTVVDNSVVTVLYTGVASAPEKESTVHDGAQGMHESQCLAYSTDPDLKTWTKLSAPVIGGPPPGMKVSGFRDPSPWRQGNEWYTTVGSGTPHKNGELLLYRSSDLRHWEYQHLAAEGGAAGANPAHTGDMWECPELFPLDGKHVLIYSSKGKARWEVGVLDTKEMKFHSEQQGVLDHGAYYAPKTQLDKSGNRIIWGWVQETRPPSQYNAGGWAGMMSLPRVLSVGSDGQLTVNVSPVVDSLRKNRHSLTATDEGKNRRQIGRMYVENCCGEVSCTTRSGQEPFSLTLFGTPPEGGAEIHCVAVRFDPKVKNQIMIDDEAVPIESSGQDSLEIHVYVDGSVAEIFLNKQVAYTKRFYYPGEKAPRIGVRISGDTANISDLSVWQFAPISANRLTT